MQFSMEREPCRRLGWLATGLTRAHFGGRNLPEKSRADRTEKPHCDKPSPVHRVMLHLHACYVSKAAILTIPVLLVPVENRSPA
jgi:hypothetical protein